MHTLKQIIADERAAGRAPPKIKWAKSSPCGAHCVLTLISGSANILVKRNSTVTSKRGTKSGAHRLNVGSCQILPQCRDCARQSIRTPSVKFALFVTTLVVGRSREIGIHRGVQRFHLAFEWLIAQT